MTNALLILLTLAYIFLAPLGLLKLYNRKKNKTDKINYKVAFVANIFLATLFLFMFVIMSYFLLFLMIMVKG